MSRASGSRAPASGGGGHSATSRAVARQRLQSAQRVEPELDIVPRRGRVLGAGMVALCLLGVVVLFGLVGFNALIVDNQARIDVLDNRLDELTAVNHRLQFTIAERESPERIRALALTELGMIEPASVTYLEPISRGQLNVPDTDTEPSQ